MKNSAAAFALLLAVLVLGGKPASLCAAEAAKPNIVLIVGDDMGYADIGVHGCQDIPTPNIDALAAGGVRCTSGYVSAPYCSPCRAGMLTGRYQTRFGHEFNPGGRGPKPHGLPLTETILPARLKEIGYKTGMVGKWHLGSTKEMHPLRRGFDEFFGFLGGAHPYFPGQGPAILRGDDPIEEKEYLTDAFRREAIAYIDRHKAEPFFLYVAFNAVHTPMDADDKRLAKFSGIKDEKRRKYAAMMLAMDEAIGAVLAKLRDSGLEDNTLVMFVSDNGGPTMKGTAMNASKNDPLKGSKRTTLDGGVRVPYFVKWPAKLKAGQVYDRPVVQLDFFPTIFAAAGVKPSADWKLDGVDLVPYFTGANQQPPHDALYWRFGKQMAVRKGDWKLVKYDSAVDGGKNGVITKAKLYNLADDIGESRDLVEQQPDKARELQAAWDQWNESNVKPLWSNKITDRPRKRSRPNAAAAQ